MAAITKTVCCAVSCRFSTRRNTLLVRIPVGRFDMASRALDFGAEAVIAPMVNSVEDARRFAASMKYPPVGERSWGPTFGLPRAGQGDLQTWLRELNSRTVAFAMIETRAALDALDGILDTPGIDGIFVGPVGLFDRLDERSGRSIPRLKT